jgi:hypothetical protein
LVRATKNETQLLGRNPTCLEHSCDNKLVVFGTLLHKLDRGLQVVEESMDIGEKDGNIATSGKVLGDLDGRNKVTAVRSTSGGSTCILLALAI